MPLLSLFLIIPNNNISSPDNNPDPNRGRHRRYASSHFTNKSHSFSLGRVGRVNQNQTPRATAIPTQSTVASTTLWWLLLPNRFFCLSVLRSAFAGRVARYVRSVERPAHLTEDFLSANTSWFIKGEMTGSDSLQGAQNASREGHLIEIITFYSRTNPQLDHNMLISLV